VLGAAAAVRLRLRINSDRGMVFFPVEVGVPYDGGAKLLLLRAIVGGGVLSGRPVRCAFPCFCLLSFGSGGRVVFFVGAPISGDGGMRFAFSSFAKGGESFFSAVGWVAGSSVTTAAAFSGRQLCGWRRRMIWSTRASKMADVLAPDFFVYERLCLVVCFYCGRSTTFVSSM